MQIKSQKPKQSLLTFFIRLATTNSLSLGIRYENINLQSITITVPMIFQELEQLFQVNNNSDVWIPGMGILYKINEDYNVFTSIHKGFSPPGQTLEKMQKVVSTQNLVFASAKMPFYGELIGYYNNFSNLQGTDNMSGGGTGTGICSMQVQQLLKELNFRRLMTY
jgi:Fe(3+) dicitrate transport protein